MEMTSYWPQKKINFREIIPISAKHSPKTVQYVKDRIRQHLDAIDDEKKKMVIRGVNGF